VQPMMLAPNQPNTFYRGSGRMATFRDRELPPRPEDWVGSTTTRFAQQKSGLSALADGMLLIDAISADPAGWLGPDRASTDDPSYSGLLVKLLDAGQRLPLHVHPSKAFARSHLASPYGKTEAWVVLDAAPGAVINMGFTRDVSLPELSRWVDQQQVAELLEVTHRVPVQAGDAILCPAGMPHAIGSDILLVELQEPSDLSIMLEWEGFPLTREDAFLGLSSDDAMHCVDRSALTGDRLGELRTPAPGSLLPVEAAEFFRAQPWGAGVMDAAFSIVIVTANSGILAGAWGELPVSTGDTVVLPFGAGPVTVSGAARGIRCRPPALRDRR
jgi:mannose-6-phosphate isomerase